MSLIKGKVFKRLIVFFSLKFRCENKLSIRVMLFLGFGICWLVLLKYDCWLFIFLVRMGKNGFLDCDWNKINGFNINWKGKMFWLI